jgi:hypothetical protein
VDVVRTGPGWDSVTVRDDNRADRINCGTGRDTVIIVGAPDPLDTFVDCEQITPSRPAPAPLPCWCHTRSAAGPTRSGRTPGAARPTGRAPPGTSGSRRELSRGRGARRWLASSLWHRTGGIWGHTERASPRPGSDGPRNLHNGALDCIVHRCWRMCRGWSVDSVS